MADQKPLTGLESTFSHLLARRRSRSLLRRLTTAPPGTVDFSSNDYLSLSTHPEIRSTFLSLLQAPEPTTTTTTNVPSTPPPPPPIGSRGSRLLDGNNALALSLESLIAAHHRAGSGLLFNSGFDANVGLFSSVPQPGDYVVYDELIHASLTPQPPAAIVLCTPLTRSYLINYARPLIYTTALSHPSLASISATYAFLTANKTTPLLTHLHTLTTLAHALLAALIARFPASTLSLLPLPTTRNPSPILPVFTPHPRQLAAHCQAKGYMVRAIVAPTVPRGAERT
ncbi:putative 8-amino-7-oxononanoate synthase [Diplodia seriata]|uniref:Putative 8-amino-7-oxononanoate synthase n=1 Tax=Diplodia seriata TaxID=420778 RepID=A0A0G2E208_9PEZI|nr:putative 8-amino-7-oxononanoate synthase [Diplodia seriata]